MRVDLKRRPYWLISNGKALKAIAPYVAKAWGRNLKVEQRVWISCNQNVTTEKLKTKTKNTTTGDQKEILYRNCVFFEQ
jgi:hypothetical protein